MGSGVFIEPYTICGDKFVSVFRGLDALLYNLICSVLIELDMWALMSLLGPTLFATMNLWVFSEASIT